MPRVIALGAVVVLFALRSLDTDALVDVPIARLSIDIFT